VRVALGPAYHHPRIEGQRFLRPEPRLTIAIEYGHPLLRVRVGGRVGDLVRPEVLEGEVVVPPRRDRNPAKPRWAQLDEILRCGAEDPEVVQDLPQISDRVVHPTR
jgi:hypothetical protein